ncbi:hypothetical protein Clacol_009352 [Clathrus columnatus]|uniref:PITH domain-containing protein n=1 Tax=Clathrus columnatus TaxID=1419009 RepID=A0AAV5AK89_9AGAM|nr:hypothetical protein Clacol_009352 [Clathrus columnatus]
MDSSETGDALQQSVASELVGTDSSSLYGIIDKNNVHGLNLEIPEQARDVIKSWDEREDTTKFADSGVDDQVEAYVNARFLLNGTLGRGELTPRRLRLYANRPSIVDFTDAESIQPQLDIQLSEAQIEATEYPLRVAAFANVTSLSLYFSDAVGTEQTRIFYIGFKGDTSNPRKDVRTKIDLPAANAADAPLVDRLKDKSASHNTVR